MPLFSNSDCTIDLNMPELQYLSDHLTEEECHKLVAALHFQTFNVPQQAAAAERKLPEDVSCLDLLLHWNSEAGEGKGGTHVEVCHRLNQIGRRDLASWLSKTVFHELSKELDDSVVFLVTEETTRSNPIRVTEARKQAIVDESPWLNLDSVLALLVLVTMLVFTFGCLYLCCLCFTRIRNEKKTRRYEKVTQDQAKTEKVRRKETLPRRKGGNLPSSEDESVNLLSKKETLSK